MMSPEQKIKTDSTIAKYFADRYAKLYEMQYPKDTEMEPSDEDKYGTKPVLPDVGSIWFGLDRNCIVRRSEVVQVVKIYPSERYDTIVLRDDRPDYTVNVYANEFHMRYFRTEEEVFAGRIEQLTAERDRIQRLIDKTRKKML